ncbi:UDP-glucose/GDP-mannose dehydrogenase family protein [Bacillus smithii]|uniref:UDP-glucose dehydrogenase family protein n=1 Tax=Bacillus smithii TaxID=1479 RepID=UPI003D259E8D
MKICVIGTGYVGLVTGVCLADINHSVTCIDNNHEKVQLMKKGISPIYEPGLDELMKRNIERGTLTFTESYEEGIPNSDVIFIAVGTPQKEDGSADLQYVEDVAAKIGQHISPNTIVVIKSTVPVGTNVHVKECIKRHMPVSVPFYMASNPEFLREGSAIYDTLHPDRIVIGAENEEVAQRLKELYEPFEAPFFVTDIASSELIKYASNAFLATKISFINEISNICDKVGANIEDVADGMGYDRRIGRSFLNAGIGYGGSCFPKDTHALVQIAGNVNHDFELLRSVIEVNNKQQRLLIEKIEKRLGSLKGKKIALLGLAFKPNTDDMREAASIVIAKELVQKGVKVAAYDPIAIPNAKKLLPESVEFTNTYKDAIQEADAAVIVTEWDEFKEMDLTELHQYMKEPLLFDGRNCFTLDQAKKADIEYHSIGRKVVEREQAIVR